MRAGMVSCHSDFFFSKVFVSVGLVVVEVSLIEGKPGCPPDHFDPRALYGARPADGEATRTVSHISIRAPHKGHDTVAVCVRTSSIIISIHTPFCATQYFLSSTGSSPRTFRSTHFTKKCGVNTEGTAKNNNAFRSTRPSRGVTVGRGLILVALVISIHAPLMGRDCKFHARDGTVRGISILMSRMRHDCLYFTT